MILLRTQQKIVYHALSLRYFEIFSKHQSTLAFIQFPVIHKKLKNHKYMWNWMEKWDAHDIWQIGYQAIMARNWFAHRIVN